MNNELNDLKLTKFGTVKEDEEGRLIFSNFEFEGGYSGGVMTATVTTIIKYIENKMSEHILEERRGGNNE